MLFSVSPKPKKIQIPSALRRKNSAGSANTDDLLSGPLSDSQRSVYVAEIFLESPFLT